MVRVRCRHLSKLHVHAVYSNRRPPSLFDEHCEILRWRTLRKTLKRWWGRLEKRRVETESGGDETGNETGGSGDETGDKTAATAGDERDGGDRWGNVYGRRFVYNRRSPSLFGEHCEILRWRKTLKRWWGRLEKRQAARESGGDETRGPGDETCDKTAVTAGDERDGGNRWVNVYGLLLH